MRIPLTLLAIGALASAASANPTAVFTSVLPDEERPAFRFAQGDHLDVDRADLSLTTVGGELRGSLTLQLSTRNPANMDRSIMIGVPKGTEVRTLSVSIAGERLTAYMATTDAARAAYQNTVDRVVDPALLEYVTSYDDQDWLQLRVFPVVPGSPARIRLGLGMPQASHVAIDPLPTARISVDNVVASGTNLDTRLDLEVRPSLTSRVSSRPQFVRDGASLVAGATMVARGQRCPDEHVCLREITPAKRVAAKPRTKHARESTHRMRIATRSRQLGQIRLAGN